MPEKCFNFQFLLFLEFWNRLFDAITRWSLSSWNSFKNFSNEFVRTNKWKHIRLVLIDYHFCFYLKRIIFLLWIWISYLSNWWKHFFIENWNCRCFPLDRLHVRQASPHSSGQPTCAGVFLAWNRPWAYFHFLIQKSLRFYDESIITKRWQLIIVWPSWYWYCFLIIFFRSSTLIKWKMENVKCSIKNKLNYKTIGRRRTLPD